CRWRTRGDFRSHRLNRVMDQRSLLDEPSLCHLDARQDRDFTLRRFAELQERQRKLRLKSDSASMGQLVSKVHDSPHVELVPGRSPFVEALQDVGQLVVAR